MLVKCIRNTGADLGSPKSWAIHTEGTVFNLEIGRTYQVFGMGLFREVLAVLVFNNTPNFLPVGLFDFSPQRIPDDWDFAVHDPLAASGSGEPSSWVAIWGYPELARDPAYAERLVDRDPEALDVFYLQLASASKDLLTEVIERRAPQMLDWVSLIGSERIGDERRDELHRAVVEEMDAEGFFYSGDPTDRARKLDDLLVQLPYL